MPPEPLWKVADVAAYLGVSERTVRDWQAKRKLPFVRIGATTRYRPAAIRAWAATFDEGPYEFASAFGGD